MRLSKSSQAVGIAVQKSRALSSYMQKKIECELLAYCKSEARGFFSWHELSHSHEAETENGPSIRRS
jgi:hypothetical protein